MFQILRFYQVVSFTKKLSASRTGLISQSRHFIKFNSTHNRILLRMRGLIWINIRQPMLAIWESLKALCFSQNRCYINKDRTLSATLKSRLLRWSFQYHFTFSLGSIVVLPRNWLSSVSSAICWSFFLTIILLCSMPESFPLAKRAVKGCPQGFEEKKYRGLSACYKQ